MADFLTSIGDMLGLNKGKGTIAAADQNSGILSDLQKQISGLIDTGDTQTRGYLSQANDLASLGANGGDIYRSALGVSGDHGAAAADAFHTTPGYNFTLDQGLDALDRRAAASGKLQSGGADADAMKFAEGTANGAYNDWFDNLNGGMTRNIGTLGDLASLSQNTSGQRIGLAGDIASGQMGVNNQRAGGTEAGQGSLWDLADNVAGVAGSVFGLNVGGGLPGVGGGTPGTVAGMGAGAAGGVPRPFGGYGRF